MHSSSSPRNCSSVSGQCCPIGRVASMMSLPMRPFRDAHRLKGLHTSCHETVSMLRACLMFSQTGRVLHQ